ncbi:MAG: antibiotic biosynthesis monooxygenase [Gammaproteobacteria bacterium]|nr:antibiotic biosynthesis monooxygenase [Gammaproteobacteria bacterium]MBT4491928.1 antibiotic biosynthesis monooxygenase [Gammaproteobacteria bacterium]
MTVIVAGFIDFEDPGVIADMLRAAKPLIDGALQEDGNIAYSWTEDHLTPGRVWVYEEWISSDVLETHLNTDWYRNMGVHLASHNMKPPIQPILRYRIEHQEPVYDESATARGNFFTADEAHKADMTVIVAGYFDFANPAEIPDVIKSSRPLIEGALTEEGCIAYSWTEDHLIPGRIFVYEEWASSKALDAHLNSHWYRDMGAHLGTFERKPMTEPILKYRADLQEPIYDETGVASGHFKEA